MGEFAPPNPLRPVILAAAKSARLQHAIVRAPVTRNVVQRFVSGTQRSDVLEVATALLASGRMVSVDYLGEQVTDRRTADQSVDEYVALINDLGNLDAAAANRVRTLEVSLKLSALGQALRGDGVKVATENAWKICAAAESSGVWVTVDAEDHTTTDATLATVGELRADYPWLGVVVQAYLRRTESDLADLTGAGSRIRLCKGAYREPKSVAFQRRAEVDESYKRCLSVLMRGDGYPMVASHDPQMIVAAGELITATGRAADSFEHQMLYGIRDLEQQRLAADGKGMRVYVPYGTEWYGYFMRRLAERPANLRFFLRSLATRH
ncbi:proline dehydrogenase [Skermania sp. ID1734]|uniref:proline dehydrogenase family protein n=1 Tax=Skermania sp. ID1734 TaxID=2597516 RepID=UPI00117BECA0|nr:proline dehydrogenase family protein [Skermania sp. ID1734]TSE01929.1 proline dehydrogenase [Skermania sp. ID1734]